MPAKKRNEALFEPREMETIIARARRDRDEQMRTHFRTIIGSLFGR